MKNSISYYLTLGIIKLKGLKKKFSQDPIDYKLIRKEDVHQPKGNFFKKYIRNTFQILKSSITEVSTNEQSQKLLLFFHGGAFISGPGQHHWDTIKQIAKNTNYTIWMCNYPKAPEHKISEISSNIDAVYSSALADFKSNEITIMGDSVGATLITSLTQRLIKSQKQIPNKLILISPVMDATFSNSEIEKVDIIDPMLSKVGLLSAKKMCAADTDLKDSMISPINGSFENFPETTLYLAENDITYPDQKIAVDKFKKAGVNLHIVLGENMPHIWPLLPIMKEARISLNEIIRILDSNKKKLYIRN